MIKEVIKMFIRNVLLSVIKDELNKINFISDFELSESVMYNVPLYTFQIKNKETGMIYPVSFQKRYYPENIDMFLDLLKNHMIVGSCGTNYPSIQFVFTDAANRIEKSIRGLFGLK